MKKEIAVILGFIVCLTIAKFVVHISYAIIADMKRTEWFYEQYKDDSGIKIFKNMWIHYVRQTLIQISSDNEDIVVGRYRCSINIGDDDWAPSVYPETWHQYEIDSTQYTSAIKKIWVQSQSFEEVQETYGLGKEEVLTRVSEVIMTFHDMGLWSVFAIYDGLYYEFTISRDDVVVYVPDWDLLDGTALEKVNKLKRKATRFFDRHWFAYKLGKPYDLG
jgi:hypothetical protein